MSSRRTFLIASAGAAVRAQESQPDIFQAAAAGNVARVKEFLDANPLTVRARSSDGRTPLHHATAAGKLETVNLLLARGAELSVEPESPLLAAIDLADHETASAIAQILLINASDPNARQRDGRTALQIAQARGYTDIADLLVHRGAAADNPGKVEIAWYGRRYIQDLRGRPVKRDDLNGLPWTLVNQFVSLSHADFDKVKQMLKDQPALLHTRASWDELAVEAGAHMGRLDITGLMADAGATISTCTAISLGQQEMVRASLAADRRTVYERGAHDLPILAYTAYANQQTAIADQLLRGGASVDARAFGQTTLHLAAGKGHLELAAVLIEHGADLKAAAQTRSGPATPFDLAVRNKQEKMAQLLKERAAQ
jgi:ankyrin repeat protein